MTVRRIVRPAFASLAVPRSLAAAGALLGVLLGAPAGAQTFGPRTDLNTGSVPRSVEVADVNGDGHPDILVAVQGASAVSIFRGNGER